MVARMPTIKEARGECGLCGCGAAGCHEELTRLRSEREELLGALRSVAIQAHPPNGSGLTQGDIKLEMERIALTAIAKAEGRTP